MNREMSDRLGYALGVLSNENAIVTSTVDEIRRCVLALFPELLEAPKRGRKAPGLSRSRLTEALAQHHDWLTMGYLQRPDGTRWTAIRVLSDDVRREIGHPLTAAKALEKEQLKCAATRFSMQLFQIKWNRSRNLKPKNQRTPPNNGESPERPRRRRSRTITPRTGRSRDDA